MKNAEQSKHHSKFVAEFVMGRAGTLGPTSSVGPPITSGRWEAMEPGRESGKKRVHYVVELAPNAGLVDGSDQNHVSLKLVVSAASGEGAQTVPVSEKKIDLHATKEIEEKIREKGLALKGIVELGPGDYTVHIVVRDELSGRIGSVITPLKVE